MTPEQSEQVVRVSGAHSSAFTGAAVVHRELAQRLPDALPAGVIVENVQQAGHGLARRLFGDRSLSMAAVLVQTSTPMPLITRADVLIPIVYDVRWRWTRGRVDRWYRHADLLQTAARSAHILTISHTVADQLEALRAVPSGGLTVLSLGPGQFQEIQPPQVDDRPPVVLLIGTAPHKRNELAAALLTQIRTVRDEYNVIGVSVSEETKRTLTSSLPTSRLTFLENLNVHELAATYATARSYVALGLSEGFGFPYIEAAHQGCDVIAPMQSVTIELLGDDGVLLSSITPTVSELEGALRSWDRERVARLQHRATQRSWDRATAQVASVVRERLGP
jgi:hypothetical protein